MGSKERSTFEYVPLQNLHMKIAREYSIISIVQCLVQNWSVRTKMLAARMSAYMPKQTSPPRLLCNYVPALYAHDKATEHAVDKGTRKK